MNWEFFKKYLKETIIQKKKEKEEQSIIIEEEYEMNDTDYQLQQKIQYNIENPAEVVKALLDLIKSIKKTASTYSLDTKYYALPLLIDDEGRTKIIDKDLNAITWQELFPDRDQVFFGKKGENDEQMSEDTYNTLAQIFNDFVIGYTRKERLVNFSADENMMNELMIKGLTRLNASALKRKGYDNKLRNWLAEYEKLEEADKKQLEKQQKGIVGVLAVLEEETSWYQSIPWKKVMWYGGISLLVIVVLLVIRWLWNKAKN